MQSICQRLSLFFALVALVLPAAARGSETFQLTITPALLVNFYGSGQSADEFTSNYEDISYTGANAAPMFGQAVLTFTTPDINANHNVSPSAVTMDIPELNAYGPIAEGDNLVPSPTWTATNCSYVSSGNPSVDDTLAIQLDNGIPGSDQQYFFYLNFPGESEGQGSALSGSLNYYNYTFDPGSQDYVTYTFDSAAMVQVVPEPASLALLSTVSFGLLRIPRRRR